MNKIRFHRSDFELSNYTNIHLDKGLDLEPLNIDDGELDELLFDNVLEYISIKIVEDTLARLSKKVKRGGIIRVSGTDIIEVSKMIAGYRMDLQEINRSLFGEQAKDDVTKKCVFNVNHIVAFFSEILGFKILKQRINGVEFVVEAERK